MKFKLLMVLFCFLFLVNSYALSAVDPSKPGTFKVGFIKTSYEDQARKRNIPTNIFYPAASSGENANPDLKSAPYPLILISHGFGADAFAYQYLGEYLVTQGYVVIIPEHIGSNLSKLLGNLETIFYGDPKEFNIDKIVNSFLEVDEYVNRPKDITFLIDKAEQLNKEDKNLKGLINTQKIGIAGHSFGGYTVLVSAGGEIDVPYLHKSCPEDMNADTLMKSMFTEGPKIFQCLITMSKNIKDFSKPINLGDKRVKAVISMAPVTSSIFGEKGEELSKIKIPLMLMAGDDDKTANFKSEQLINFAKFNNPKYFLVLIGGSHLSFNDYPEKIIKNYNLTANMQKFYVAWHNLPFISMPTLNMDTGHLYIKTFATVFYDYYLKSNKESQKFLTSEYADELSGKRGELLLVAQP